MSAADIEVTPEMRAAGVRILADTYDLIGPELAETIVGPVFVAMMLCRRAAVETHQSSNATS